MRAELELITASAPIHATSADIDKIDHLLCEVTDWNYLLDMMVKNCAAGLFYRKLPLLKYNNLIPAETQKLFKKAYQTTFIHNTRLYTEFTYMASVLQAHNIPFVTLKGICMAEWLYGDIGLRQMSDIDILIQEKDGVRCLDALHSAGYVSQKEFMVDAFVDAKSQNHFNPLFRNDVMVEIHIRLQNTREIYQQNLQEVWRDAVPVTLNGMETLRLKLSDMLIHACLHLDKHFVTKGVQFTSFNDIVNLLREITSPQPSQPLPNPLQEERESANLKQAVKLEGSEKENNERENAYKKKAASLNVTIKNIENNRNNTIEKSYIEKSIYQTKLSTETLTPSPTGEGWGEVSWVEVSWVEDFWERFEAKCIQYNFADTVFTYLIVVTHYYKAPLPQYLVDKYGSLLTEDVKNRFENFLAGTGNEFIGRGAPKSATATHILHLKQLKNPVDFMRYVKGVVFPGKEFMISKYIENKEQIEVQRRSRPSGRAKNQDDRKDTSSYHHIITSKFWWLWYPYRWWVALRAVVGLRR